MSNVTFQDFANTIRTQINGRRTRNDRVWLTGWTIRIERQIILLALDGIVDSVQLVEQIMTEDMELEASVFALRVIRLHKETHRGFGRVLLDVDCCLFL